MQVTFYDEPEPFLLAAEPTLARDSLSGSVVATAAAREADSRRAGHASNPPHWYAVVYDGRGVVGIAMRTHPHPPHAMWMMAMPEEAAELLAQALLERREDVEAVNGSVDAAQTLLRRMGEGTGRVVVVRSHLRLFEVHHVIPPVEAPGRLRPAATSDAPLVAQWLAAFDSEASEQSGRQSHDYPALPTEEVVARIAAGRYWLWENGEVVHLTGASAPSFGVVRVGPVYTPAQHRGKGYAANAVAEISTQALAAGHRVCLYTDQANPVSNKVYQRLGYVPVRDEGELVQVGHRD